MYIYTKICGQCGSDDARCNSPLLYCPCYMSCSSSPVSLAHPPNLSSVQCVCRDQHTASAEVKRDTKSKTTIATERGVTETKSKYYAELRSIILRYLHLCIFSSSSALIAVDRFIVNGNHGLQSTRPAAESDLLTDCLVHVMLGCWHM